MTHVFSRPDPGHARADRTFEALCHLMERHARTPELRARATHPSAPHADEVVKIATGMAAGTIPVDADEDEEALDATDVVAALTLLPEVRADLNEQELQLIRAARNMGMTWNDIAFALGLNSPQAARQRFERLEARSLD